MEKSLGVLLAAAGRSERFDGGPLKKVFQKIDRKPLWQHAAEVFVGHPWVHQIVLIVHPNDQEFVQEQWAGTMAMLGIDWVLGGDERWQSVQRGLERLRPEIEWVAVHDAARPCLTRKAFESVAQGAIEHGAAILAQPIHGTVKRGDLEGLVAQTVPRDRLWQAQTPQIARRQWLEEAYKKRGNLSPTDESQLLEHAGYPVRLVEGSPWNIKVTRREDLRFAEIALRAEASSRKSLGDLLGG
jgi:2-C-methyl-D-erythritol 4-phosphate cytidylyltransferase